MIFTKEQFDSIFGKHGLPMDDLPFTLSQEEELRLFNSLPEILQGQFLSWGSDTETKDEFFVWVVYNQWGVSPEDYYNSGLYTYPQQIDWYKITKEL